MRETGWEETEKLDKAHTQRQCGGDSRSAPTPPQPFPWLQCSSSCEQSEHTLAYFLLQPNSHSTIPCSLHPVSSLGRRNVLASHISELKEIGTSWSGICEVLSPGLVLWLAGVGGELGVGLGFMVPPGRPAVKGGGDGGVGRLQGSPMCSGL